MTTGYIYTLHDSEPARTNNVVFSVTFNIAQVLAMSHKVLPMEAKTALETPKDKWSTTSVTLGLNFLEIKTEPVNLMDSGQGVSHCVLVR